MKPQDFCGISVSAIPTSLLCSGIFRPHPVFHVGPRGKGGEGTFGREGFFLGKAVPIPTLLHSLPCPIYKHRLGLRSRWHQNEHLIICRQIPPFASIPEAALTLSPPGISLHPSLIFLLSRTWHSFSASLCLKGLLKRSNLSLFGPGELFFARLSIFSLSICFPS